MASFNLANIFFFCFFVYIKLVYSTSGSQPTSNHVVPATPSSEQSKLGVVFEKDDKFLKYTFEEGTRCLGFEYDGVEILNLGPEDPYPPYPKSLYLSRRGNTAFVKFHESVKILSRDVNGTWKSIFSGKAIGRELDIGSKESNCVFKYTKAGKVHTYTSKEKFLFNQVKNSNGGSCFSGSKMIWTPGFSDEFATKVVYDESDSKRKVVTIHQLDGLIRTFTKKSRGEWKVGVSNDSEAELTTDKVEIHVEGTPRQPGVRIEKDDKYLKYVFDDGTECLKFEYDRKDVLKINRQRMNEYYPQSVIFAIRGNTAIVYFKRSMVIRKLDDNGEWNPVSYVIEDKKTLNILYKKDGDHYCCKNDGKVYTYTPKHNGLFFKVRYHPAKGKEEVLFETSDPVEMARMIVYDETNPKILVVTTHGVNGLKRTFSKESGAEWKESSPTYSGNELEENKVEIEMRFKHANLL